MAGSGERCEKEARHDREEHAREPRTGQCGHRVERRRTDDAGRRSRAVVGLAQEPRTRTYVARRTHEGRFKREIIRSLKRYVARELYRCLPRPPARLTTDRSIRALRGLCDSLC